MRGPAVIAPSGNAAAVTRTHIIWLSFIAAMTIVTGLLAIGDGDSPGGFPATRTGLLSSGLAPDVIFDIEAIFLYPWSVLFQRLGWVGLVEMLVFLSVLTAALIYCWKKGALEWEA